MLYPRILILDSQHPCEVLSEGRQVWNLDGSQLVHCPDFPECQHKYTLWQSRNRKSSKIHASVLVEEFVDEEALVKLFPGMTDPPNFLLD